MSETDQTAHSGLRVLAEEELCLVSGGTKNVKTPKATVRAFETVVADAVLTMDELATLHEMT